MKTNNELDRPVLDNDLALERFVGGVLERADRRQVWVFFLDDEQRPLEVMMPCDDYPLDPLEVEQVPDLGSVTSAELFGARFVGIMEHFGGLQAVVVWERPGKSQLQDAERRWASYLGKAIVNGGGALRAQLLLHDSGARVIAPDDLL